MTIPNHISPALLISVIVLVVVVMMVVYVIRHRLLIERRLAEEVDYLHRKVVQSEMLALRSQMNPHFIFNAINSIQHYVLTNEKELANKYLVKFSKLMRSVLELSKEELVPLKDELDTAKLYLEIEALRFNDAFDFEIICDPGVDNSSISLPPLLIQPFIENAIWHGLLLKEGPKRLLITVQYKNDFLEITIDDNGIGREMAGRFKNEELKRKSFALDITSDRLAILQQLHGLDVAFKVLDKTENGKADGTRVIITIKQNKI